MEFRLLCGGMNETKNTRCKTSKRNEKCPHCLTKDIIQGLGVRAVFFYTWAIPGSNIRKFLSRSPWERSFGRQCKIEVHHHPQIPNIGSEKESRTHFPALRESQHLASHSSKKCVWQQQILFRHSKYIHTNTIYRHDNTHCNLQGTQAIFRE